MGIEPTSSAWKAEVLPLNYTRILETVPSFDLAAPSGSRFSWCTSRARFYVAQKNPDSLSTQNRPDFVVFILCAFLPGSDIKC